MNNLCIAIIAYNRMNALSTLLESLSKITYNESEIDLIFTIENGATSEVTELVNSFSWNLGRKIIIRQEKKLGLRNHFLWVGDLTEEYENVLFLEDDLIVSPVIIEIVQKYILKYKYDARVAGISLYSPSICEFNATRFYPLSDGYDNYFFQHPYWGNVWQREKWAAFRQWFNTYKRNDVILPIYARTWKETSFKVVYIQYLIETSRYIVFPRESVVNNMGFTGLHNGGKRNGHSGSTFVVPMKTTSINERLSTFEESRSIYDAYFEIEPSVLKQLNPALSKYDFEVDLNRTRDNFKMDYVITHGESNNPIISFYGYMKPAEYGIAGGINGKEIVLSRREDIVRQVNSRQMWYNDYCANNMSGKRYLVRIILFSIRRLISLLASTK